MHSAESEFSGISGLPPVNLYDKKMFYPVTPSYDVTGAAPPISNYYDSGINSYPVSNYSTQ